MYNNKTLECVESFKYLGVEVPSNHRGFTRHLEAGKRAYYAFEHTCNHGDIKCWVLKKYLSTLWWYRCFSMGWKYGVVTSVNLLGKSLKMSKNIFLQSFYKSRNKRCRAFRLRIVAWVGWEPPRFLTRRKKNTKLRLVMISRKKRRKILISWILRV